MLNNSNIEAHPFKLISNFNEELSACDYFKEIRFDIKFINHNINSFSYISSNKGFIQFKQIRNTRRAKEYKALQYIFMPPGFSYLFDYFGEDYNNLICIFDQSYLSNFKSKYSYNKSVVKKREKMDEIEEDLEFGYISKWK